jgi:hypothetical protein
MPPETLSPTTVSREEFEHLKSQLDETAKTSKENNEILRKMVFWGRVAFGFKVLLWVLVLIGIPVVISTFFPFLNGLFHGALGSASGTSSSTTLFGFPSPTEVKHSLSH